jgi:O-antigen/teichoic acid export membrane protein
LVIKRNPGLFPWAMTTMVDFSVGGLVFILAPVSARILGVEGRGTLAAVQLVPVLLAQFSSVGTGYSLIHFGSKHVSGIKVFLRRSLYSAVAGSLVFYVIGQLVAASIALNPTEESMVRVYLFLCPLSALTAVMLDALRTLGLFVRWNVFTALRLLIWPISLLVGILQTPPSMWLIILLHLSLAAALLVILSVEIWRVFGVSSETIDEGSIDIDEVTTRKYIKFGLNSLLGTIPAAANARLDQVIMISLVAKEELGLYAVAVGWSYITVPIMRSFALVTQSLTSSKVGEAQKDYIQKVITVGAVTGVLVLVPSWALTLILWAPLYGQEYRSALASAMVMLLVSTLLQQNALLANMLRSFESPTTVSMVEFPILLVGIPLLFIALKFEPVLGATLVSLATAVTANILFMHNINKKLELSWRGTFRDLHRSGSLFPRAPWGRR